MAKIFLVAEKINDPMAFISLLRKLTAKPLSEIRESMGAARPFFEGCSYDNADDIQEILLFAKNKNDSIRIFKQVSGTLYEITAEQFQNEAKRNQEIEDEEDWDDMFSPDLDASEREFLLAIIENELETWEEIDFEDTDSVLNYQHYAIRVPEIAEILEMLETEDAEVILSQIQAAFIIESLNHALENGKQAGFNLTDLQPINDLLNRLRQEAVEQFAD